ncbi:MAG TPA: cupin-like domain-containing protein [Bacteroidales bacterium]|nr:cupin-like domain-containing protein [Bacteroidales bacterium]
MDLNIEHPVPIVENISHDEFRSIYQNPQKPVILRGLWKDYPATSKWTIDYFKKEMGNIMVGVYDAGTEKADRSTKAAPLKMKFGDYLDAITSGPSDLRLFLFNILKHKPELRKDFDYPPITSMYLKQLPFMFFGGKDSVVRMHQDMDFANVFLTQLKGKKLVVLFSPKYSRFLYRYPFNVHSSVDVEHPDFHKYPALRFVQGQTCILEPGDTLFMPSGYWHYIKYLEGGYAINQRALSPHPAHWFRGFYNVAVLSNLDDLMRSMMGESWYQYKLGQTYARANNAMSHLSTS